VRALQQAESGEQHLVQEFRMRHHQLMVRDFGLDQILMGVSHLRPPTPQVSSGS